MNAWSFLFDELNMSNQDFWEHDGISLTGNPSASYDTIAFSSTSYGAAQPVLLGGMGEDHISFGSSRVYGSHGEDTLSFNLEIPDLPTIDNTNGRWKYNEDVILKEIKEYLGGTYRSHYASPESKTQTLDLIESVGDAEPFCRSNALKYLSRFGKKDGKSKQDILKAIHYCILLYHFAGLCNENSQPYETF
tara:strand:- start:404 stop:976 length:573 start_codon:yes stop_codon:yes gene_type:complete